MSAPIKDSGWREIATAQIINWDDPHPVAIVWSKEYGVGLGHAFRFPNGQAFADRGHGDSTITHYMPLPPAPQSAAETGKAVAG